MTSVSLHQPNFMPWLRLLDKIMASDVYVAYDSVQYTKKEYHSRQKVKTQSGESWLTVPVLNSGNFQLIEEVQIDNKQPWRKKHLRLLRWNYVKAEFLDEVFPLVEEVYERNHTHLVDLNLDLIEQFCRYLGAEIRTVRSSSLPQSGDNTERVIQLVEAVGGDTHLTGEFWNDRGYMDWRRVQDAGITIRAQAFEHPIYEQLWGPFSPNLAALDMLFNCGRMTARILEERRQFDLIEAAAEPPAETGAVNSTARARMGGRP